MFYKRNIQYLIFFITCCSLFQCKYSNDEVFYNSVNENPDFPILSIDLNFDQDTIYVYRPNSSIYVNINSSNKKILGIKFFVDGVETETMKFENDVWRYVVHGYSDETSEILFERKIRAEIYVGTATGSIADLLDAESYVLSTKECVLKFIYKELQAVEEIVDGRLKISWPPVKGKDSALYIFRNDFGIIRETWNCWFIDSLYYGYSSGYYIGVNDHGISAFEIIGKEARRMPKVMIDNSKSFRIHWNKFKAYNNIRGLVLKVDNYVYDLAPEDTSFVFTEGTLGEYTNVDLFCMPVRTLGSDYTSGYCSSIEEKYQMKMISKCDCILHPMVDNDLFYVDYYGYLKKYSTESRKTICSISLNDYPNVAVSPNHKLIANYDVFNLRILDGDDFKILRKADLINSFGDNFIQFKIADNGRIFHSNKNSDTLIVKNMWKNWNTEYKIPISLKDKVFGSLIISTNGNYIFTPESNTMFSLNDNSYTKMIDNGGKYSFYRFHPFYEEKIFLVDGLNCYIKNCDDLSIINSFTLKNDKVIDVDFVNNQILAKDLVENLIHIYSLENGELIYSIPCSFYLTDLYLINNYIVGKDYAFDLRILNK